MKGNNRKHFRRLGIAVCMVGITASMATPVHAAGLMDTVLYTGALQLISDATMIATILCPILAGLLWGLFALARQTAQDEPTEKKWNKCMRNAIIFGVAGCLGSGIISALSSYFAG